MAINIKKEGDKTDLELTNGHRTALEKIVKDYKLLGEKEALEFILSVMAEANGNPISNGNGSFVPSDHLKAQPPKT